MPLQDLRNPAEHLGDRLLVHHADEVDPKDVPAHFHAMLMSLHGHRDTSSASAAAASVAGEDKGHGERNALRSPVGGSRQEQIGAIFPEPFQRDSEEPFLDEDSGRVNPAADS